MKGKVFDEQTRTDGSYRSDVVVKAD